MRLTGKCEACGEWSDNLIELASAADWADNDLWCEACIEQPNPRPAS